MRAYQSDLARALQIALRFQEERELSIAFVTSGGQQLADFISNHQALIVSATALLEACEEACAGPQPHDDLKSFYERIRANCWAAIVRARGGK